MNYLIGSIKHCNRDRIDIWVKSAIKHCSGQVVLLVLDDVCSDTYFHHSKTFKQIFTKGRHYKITLIITAQYPYHIPPIARVNCDWFLVGQINTQGLEILCTEFIAGDISKQDFIKMYYKATSNYGFLLINNNSTKSNADLNSLYGTVKVPIEEIQK